MSPALPHTGGAYSFARSAMGPWGGFLTGLAENMEYVITPAVVVGAMGLLMQQIVVGLFEVGGSFAADGSITGIAWWNSLPFWWAVFYVIFVGINIIGIEATMKFTVVITVLSLVRPGVLLHRRARLRQVRHRACWTNIPTDGARAKILEGGGGPLFPFGIGGIFKALPFAIWFFLAIEEVPLAAEESMDPAAGRPQRLGARDAHAGDRRRADAVHQHRRCPAARRSTVPPASRSSTASRRSSRARRPRTCSASSFMIGLIASFFTIIYAYGRNTYSLSRAGYFPRSSRSRTGSGRRLTWR